ncbi:MAG TPA: hypothetical protein VF421_09650 [Niabella sp.]
MNRKKNTILLLGVYSIMCCTDSSQFCKHGLPASAYFSRFHNSTKQQVAAGIMPASYFYSNEPGMVQQQPAEKLSWQQLEDVRFVQRWNQQFQQNILYPVFGKKIKLFAGHQVSISGHMIPLDINAGIYVLSRNNYAACFFCGMAGPESVISLKFKSKPRRYQTDEYITLKGTLDLNVENVNDLFYIIRNAEEVK